MKKPPAASTAIRVCEQQLKLKYESPLSCHDLPQLGATLTSPHELGLYTAANLRISGNCFVNRAPGLYLMTKMSRVVKGFFNPMLRPFPC